MLLEEENELEVYFPALHVEPKNPRASRVRPFFPGYMFVRIDLDDQGDNALRWTPGTMGLVRFGDKPAIVPDNLIGELRHRLATLQEKGGSEEKQYEKGERVRIVDGPFAGYEAIFDAHLSGNDRVHVLLSFLSREPRRLRLSKQDIEKV